MKSKNIALVTISIVAIVGIIWGVNLFINSQSVAVEHKEKSIVELNKEVAEKLLECIISKENYIITSGAEQILVIYNKELEEVMSIPTQHTSQINSISVSNDRKHIISADKNGCLAVWDLVEKKVSYIPQAHVDDILAIDFSSDDITFATSSKDRTITIWDITSLNPTVVLKGHKSYVSDIDFSPDNKYLASVGVDNNLIIWDVETGEKVKTKGNSHFRAVNQVEYSYDGKYLYTSSSDSLIKMWDSMSLELINTLEGHNNEVLKIALSSNNTLYSAGRDNSILCFNSQKGEKETSIPIENNTLTTGIVISKDLNRLFIGDLSGQIVSIDMTNNALLNQKILDPIYAMAVF